MRVLIVDDSADDALLLVRALKKGGLEAEFARVETAESLNAALEERQWDVVLSDYTMPHLDVFTALKAVKVRNPNIPFIIVSGTIGEDTAVAAIKSGASDYLMKDKLGRLVPSIEHALEEKEARRGRQEAQNALRVSEEKYRLLFQNMLNGFALHRTITDDRNRPVDYEYVEVNDAFLRQTGLSRDQVVGQRISRIKPVITGDGFKWIEEFGKVALGGKTLHIEQYSRALDRWYAVQAYAPAPGYFAAVTEDITGRKRAEAALRESEERFRNSVVSSNAGYFRIGRDGRFRDVNEAWLKMYGYSSRGEIIGRHFGDVQVDSDQAQAQKTVDQLIAGKALLTGEFSRRRRDGSIGYHTFSANPVLQGGKVIGLEGFVIDTTGRRAAEEALRQSYARLQKSFDDTVNAITKIVETRDPYTAGHQRHVSQLGYAIARELGLSEHQAQGVRVAGLLHDVGKISVPAEILSKPGRLSRIEFDVIKIHPQAGYEILKNIEFPWLVAEVAYQHQERVDGSGYPRGLRGNEILLETKIISVADTVEAMTFSRPYRPVIGLANALDQIRKGKGLLYDPAAVEACLRLFGDGRFSFSDAPHLTVAG